MVNLQQVVTDLKTHFEDAEAKAKAFLEGHLPGLADLADKAAANPLIDAALNAVHLSPEILATLAEVINKADAELGQAKAAQAAAEAAAAPPAEPGAESAA